MGTANFDTKTEEAFYNCMVGKSIKCEKIENIDKNKSIPDFLCELDSYKVIFEIKALNESGTTKRYDNGIISQSITIAGAVSGFIKDCDKKFSNTNYKNYPSSLIIFNLRPLIQWDLLISQIEKALSDNLEKYLEIGSIIIPGYNEPSNRITAFHIYKNLKSNRIINGEFFKEFNHKCYN